MKVSFYTTASNRMPVLDYIKSLEKPERSKIYETLDYLDKLGFGITGVQFRKIEGKLWEIKISAHRVFYVLLKKDEIILLHAYKKQGQKLPLKEKELAIQRMKEIL